MVPGEPLVLCGHQLVRDFKLEIPVFELCLRTDLLSQNLHLTKRVYRHSQIREAALERRLGWHLLGCAPPQPHSSIDNGTSLDAHLISIHFLEKKKIRKPFCIFLVLPPFKNRLCSSLPRGRKAKIGLESQGKQKLSSWELPRTQELTIAEISKGNFDCT